MEKVMEKSWNVMEFGFENCVGTLLKPATSHYYENVRRQGERQTENLSINHSRPETHLLRYWDTDACVTN